MKAAVLYENNKPVKVEDVTIDDPKNNEVLVKMVATGVCHTDLHFVKGEMPQPLPVVLGHEGAGIVEKVGPNVTTLKEGDHVVLMVAYSCGKCRYCVSGQPAMCPEWLGYHMIGTLPDGTKRLHKDGQDLNHFFSQSSFAEYAVVHERTAIKVRDDAPLDVVCLLGCGTTTGMGAVLNTAGVRAGDTVAIYGCGGVGLSALMAAHLAGAAKIIAVDTNEMKLQKAKDLGADFLVNAATENPPQKILEITGTGADHALECIGNAEVISQAFSSIHNGGKCVVVGMAPFGAMVQIAPFEFLLGKTITGSVQGHIRAAVDVPRYADLFMTGKLPLDKLVSKYYKLDQINEAFEALEKGQVVRSVVKF